MTVYCCLGRVRRTGDIEGGHQRQAYEQMDRNLYEVLENSPYNSDEDINDCADEHRPISPGNSLLMGQPEYTDNAMNVGSSVRQVNVDDIDPFSHTPVGLNYAKVAL